jgi:hypothetical protein
VAEIDEAIRNAPAPDRAGHQCDFARRTHRASLLVTGVSWRESSASGLSGSNPTHRFRASGWTRHYETYAEIIQIIAQLALGLALANYKNHRLNLRFKLAATAFVFLSLGVALTAMRTSLIALVIGVLVIIRRALGARARARDYAHRSLSAAGTWRVHRSQTRAEHALSLQDPSSQLRVQVARVGVSRIMLHRIFGHGMDSMHVHMARMGLPGSDMLHLHSTPLQLAFDRGLPALLLWLWIMWIFWRTTSRGEHALRDSSDTHRYECCLAPAARWPGSSPVRW